MATRTKQRLVDYVMGVATSIGLGISLLPVCAGCQDKPKPVEQVRRTSARWDLVGHEIYRTKLPTGWLVINYSGGVTVVEDAAHAWTWEGGD